MRNIGDVVWISRTSSEAVEKQCPDCLGTARWHCVLPNGEEFDVECARCYHGGFDLSNGIVCEEYKVQGIAVRDTISRIEMRVDGIEYTVGGYCGFGDDEIYDTEEEALAWAQVKSAEWADAEHKRLEEIARRKGRPSKGKRGANPMEFGGGSANYARSQVRAAIREANRWIDYAARKGTVIDFQKMITEAS